MGSCTAALTSGFLIRPSIRISPSSVKIGDSFDILVQCRLSSPPFLSIFISDRNESACVAFRTSISPLKISSAVSSPDSPLLQYLSTKRYTLAIVRISFVHDENLWKSIDFSLSTIIREISGSADSFSFGKSSSSRVKNSVPLKHLLDEVMSICSVSLVKSSATFCLVGTLLHSSTAVESRISDIRLMTKGRYFRASDRIHLTTV